MTVVTVFGNCFSYLSVPFSGFDHYIATRRLHQILHRPRENQEGRLEEAWY